MQVSNMEVWQAREPLQTLLSEPWPVKTAYWLAKLARKIGDQYAVIDQVRVKLITQHGTQNETGQIAISPESPNWPQFAAEFNDLMAITVEIPLNRIVLPDANGLTISPAALLALEPFVSAEGVGEP